MSEDRLSPIVEEALNMVSSTASASGYFDRVNTVEPKSAPGSGLTFAAWVQTVTPLPPRSGLDVTSVRFVIQTRIYKSMLTQPQDLIDITMTRASSWMLAQYTGAFQLPSNAWLDLLGAHGVPLGSVAGYISQDGSMLRTMDTLVPVIADDVFDQEAE